MDRSKARELLDILLENSRRILRAGFGLRSVESTFFDVIGLLRDQPELGAHFIVLVRNTLLLPDPGLLDDRMVPRELIELASHELRWSELAELANQRVRDRFGGDLGAARGDVACSMLEAFRDDWPDRIFYRHYGN